MQEVCSVRGLRSTLDTRQPLGSQGQWEGQRGPSPDLLLWAGYPHCSTGFPRIPMPGSPSRGGNPEACNPAPGGELTGDHVPWIRTLVTQ